VSRTQCARSHEPSHELLLDLSAHGFEPGPRTPRRAAVKLARVRLGFVLYIGTEEAGYHVQLRPGPESGGLEPVRVHRGDILTASETEPGLPGIDGLADWLRFVIEYAAETAREETDSRV